MAFLLLFLVLTGAVVLGYVAASFDVPVTRRFSRLLDQAVRKIAAHADAASDETGQAIKNATAELEKGMAEADRSVAAQVADLKEAVTGELQQELRAITGELQRDRETAEARHVQLGNDLSEAVRLVAQLAEALARQGALLTAIHGYARSQGKLDGTSLEAADQLLLAMLEAESHVDGKGWGTPPHLFALTEGMPPGPGVQVNVPHELPDGDLAEVLASTRWPQDVAGCVLVAELTSLPAGSADDAPVGPVAAAQRASTGPDGRPARLAVGVRRNGEHVCGLRVKGEQDVQVRAGMADGIVAVLLRTF